MARITALLFVIVLAGCSQKEQPRVAVRPTPSTWTSFDVSPPDEQPQPAHSVKFDQAPLDQALDLYAKTSKRSIIRGENLPDVKITFTNEQPMTRVKLLQALDTVLAARGIGVVPLGTEYVKVVKSSELVTETPPILTGSPEQLPESSSYVIFVVELPASTSPDIAQAMTPFSKMPNSIIYVPGNRPSGTKKNLAVLNDVERALGPKKKTILILRDYSSNVRNMLQVLSKVQGGNR